MPHSTSCDKGQTLIELVVTISVILGLTSLLIAYNRTGQRIARLPRAAERLIFDIRKAQNYALAIREFAPGNVPCAYGVNFITGANSYAIFADLAADCAAANGVMDAGEIVEEIRMEEGVVVRSSNISTVRFIPPSAGTAFMPSATMLGRVTLGFAEDLGFTRTITISRLGKVSLE